MRKIVFTISLFLICSAVFPVSSYADNEAGKILAVKKDVYIMRYDSQSDAKPQMTILADDVVVTGEHSRAKIFFNDDSILSLGEMSRLEVKEYIYNSEKDRSKSVYSLVEGSLRVIVGRSDLEIHTPTAVVAARGTMFIVWIDNGTHALVFDGTVTMNDLITGLNGFNINPGEVGSLSGDEPGVVRLATPEEIAQFEDVTDVIGEIMDNQNDIPDDVVTFEDIIYEGDGDYKPEDGPPIDPPFDAVPTTPVTIDVVFEEIPQ
ncbi:MAG: FecR family protein [Thermodesulfovibrionia bacterium]|nr:FecR family protein [Thermodesulfovibrionia bacterium]